MEKERGEVVSVMSFNSVMEAQLYKALLESAGIAARMQNDIAAQVIPAYGTMMEINLLVASEDEVQARRIMGAKFDIDEFKRESEAAVEKAKAEKAGKAPARKTAAGKAPAKKTGKAPAKKSAARKSSASKKSSAAETKPVKKSAVAGKPASKPAVAKPKSVKSPSAKKPAPKKPAAKK